MWVHTERLGLRRQGIATHCNCCCNTSQHHAATCVRKIYIYVCTCIQYEWVISSSDETTNHTTELQHSSIKSCNHELQHAATHCSNALQHTAAHCNTVQRIATHYNTLQHIATYCNTLQHTATHYNTLHHTATYCSTL